LYKLALLLLFLLTNIYAKTYTIYLASTKYLDIAREYYTNIKLNIPNSYDLIIRTHEKKNYSLIIRKIPTMEEAKKIQKTLLSLGKYQDSYIKMFEIEPSYDVIKIKDTAEVKKDGNIIIESFKQKVEDTNEYITASIIFNTEQYEKSYEMFFKLFLKYNDNLNINYFLARSAFSLKKYDEAIAAYERVLIIDPTFNQARYDYARILYLLKQKEKSKEEFNTLLQKNINEETKTKIKEFLEVLNKENKQTAGTAQIVVGFSRSSNVNNGLISPEYSLPGLNDIIVEGEKPIADNAAYEMLNLNLFNYVKNQPIRIQNSFLAYNKTYFNERDDDITALSYKPSIVYLDTERQQSYALELTTDKIIRRINEDFYAFAISPKFYRKDFLAYLKYQRILYEDRGNEDKDFEKIQFYASLNIFKNMNYYTNLYKNKRIEELRTDIDKYTVSNGINVFYDITKDDKINLNYQVDFSKYTYESFAFDSKREDKKHLVELSYNHSFDKLNIINISTSYTKNYSNQDAYIYEEKEFKLNYLKAFNW
jgi:hypothetical protein